MIRYIFMIILFTSLSGCSVLMPYKESFICNVPEGQGYCGSLTDVYNYSIKLEER